MISKELPMIQAHMQSIFKILLQGPLEGFQQDLKKILLRPLSISLGFAQNLPPSTCTKSCTNLLKDLTRISLGSHKKFEKPLTKIFMPGPRQQVLISSDPTKTILSDIYSCILSGIYSDLFSCNTFWQGRGGED